MDTDPETLLTNRDLIALLDTANQLNSFETLDRTLTQILNLAAKLTDSQAGSVILHDQPRNDLNAIKLSVKPEPLCTCDQFRWGLSCLI